MHEIFECSSRTGFWLLCTVSDRYYCNRSYIWRPFDNSRHPLIIKGTYPDRPQSQSSSCKHDVSRGDGSIIHGIKPLASFLIPCRCPFAVLAYHEHNRSLVDEILP